MKKSPRRRFQSSRPRSHSCPSAHPRRKALPPRQLLKRRPRAPKARQKARRLLPAKMPPVKRSVAGLKGKVLSALKQLQAAASQDARALSRSVRKRRKNAAYKCNKRLCCRTRKKKTK